jgi:ferrochelatase
MSPSTSPVAVLVNLGTPDAPTPRAVRRYLSEFLHDHRVVQLTRWLWCPLLHGLILPLRGSRVARKYAAIWLDSGSPLAVYTQQLAATVQQRLPQARVLHAMRYGNPSLATVLRTLRQEDAAQVVVLPLYPQYSDTTTGSVADVIAQNSDGRVQLVRDYHLDPDWIAAIAESIRTHWTTQGRGHHLLLSLHGIPQRLVAAGDPYAAQCQASAAAIAQALELAADEWTLAYQSRFGREQWLQPATVDVLDRLAQRGVRVVDVVCPGFAVDCLETLEEISMTLSERFARSGGQLRYVPCLNASPAHAAAIAALLRDSFR